MTNTPSGQRDDAEPIYPHVHHPYYIVAPPYVRTSAGVRVLHLLCHALNRKGYAAYVLIYPYMAWRSDQIEPDLLTPILSPHIVHEHRKRGVIPIMVYPETVAGNPFEGPCVVRYVLNFPGLLGGDKIFPPEELCFGYSEVLATAAHVPDNVLFMPAIDTRIFRAGPKSQQRAGTCYYASKYKIAYKGQTFAITRDSVEITRDLLNSQTPQEIADLFRRSEFFYTYENTALVTEAVLCGCPAVFLPNPYLEEMIAVQELGKEGYAWGSDPSELARAKATVEQGRDNYLKSYKAFWTALDRFIELTQKHAEGKPYTHPVSVPGFWATLRHVIRQFGFLGFIKLALRKLYKMCVISRN